MAGQMSLRSDVTWDAFNAGEVIREVFWRREPSDREVRVRVYCSTERSEQTERVGDWAVYLMLDTGPGYHNQSTMYYLDAKLSVRRLHGYDTYSDNFINLKFTYFESVVKATYLSDYFKKSTT